jgi:hypothetical protein
MERRAKVISENEIYRESKPKKKIEHLPLSTQGGNTRAHIIFLKSERHSPVIKPKAEGTLALTVSSRSSRVEPAGK